MKILKIGAQWCPECVIMKPRWEEIEKEIPALQIMYLDADKEPAIKKKYNIEHLPTFIFFDRQDKEILRLKGLVEKDELLKLIVENQAK